MAPLLRTADDLQRLAARLAEFGVETVCVFDPDSAQAVDKQVGEALPPDSLSSPGDVLVMLWSGHAARNETAQTLDLLTAGEAPGDAFTMTPRMLAERAAKSGASQILILLDTCYSGAGTLDALAVVTRALHKHPAKTRDWAGVLASCGEHERAVEGALVAKLLSLLTNGPADPILRLRWSTYQADLRGDDLVDAVVREWDEDRQTLSWYHSGDAQGLIRNPLFHPRAQDRIAEHLLTAARGGAQAEQANWFTGREAQLRAIVGWLRQRKPGLCVVTGPAGCGKSAIVGRIVSLSTTSEREEIAQAEEVVPELDPGNGSVDAHVQTRGLDVVACSRILADTLGVRVAFGHPSHHDVLAWSEKRDRPPVVVVDGLDEAGDQAESIATELLAPLSTYALVLVASRNRPASEEGKTLLGKLGSPALSVDLGSDPIGTDADIDRYTRARLANSELSPAHGVMDIASVASAITRLVAETGGPTREGGFLLARMLTSQLRERPVDTSVAGWEVGLARSVEDVLFQDLEMAQPLVRDGESIAGAGRDLLAALSFSYGPGFPSDDVWPAVANAIRQGSVAYERPDVFWALEQYQRYVTASSIGGQAVYRLHQRLAEALRANYEDDHRDLAATVPTAVLGTYEQFLRRGGSAVQHPYLWRYAWRHAVDAESAGIARLERLVQRDHALRPDLASALNSLSMRYSRVGRRADAVAPAERAVEIYEQLVAENPAFLNDLASALNNLGAFYSGVGRRADAVAPAERAVEIYEAFAAENPAFLNDLASALNNLGIRYSEVGRRADAVAPTGRAVEIYEQLAADNPAFLNDLASALNNLGIRYSGVGRRADAVAPTERALEIYEQLAADNPAFLNDLASALNNLGAFYSEVGRRADAVAPAERAVEIYEALAAENPAFLNDLASALNNLGIRYSEVDERNEQHRRWNAVLERFATEPTAAIVLHLGRERSAEEYDEAINDLLRAQAIDPGDDLALTAQLHAAARALRRRDSERFDARWTADVGQPPEWLLVDEDALRAATDWINTPTWETSQGFLSANADRLLTKEGETALAELALATQDSPLVSQHQAILQAVRQHGVDATYRPLLMLDTIDTWLDLQSLEASKHFLIMHHDDLTAQAATEILIERNAFTHHAIATLGRFGRIDDAYALLQTPNDVPTALATARREKDPDELHALGLFARTIAQDDTERALAGIHIAIAFVLSGEDDQAATLVSQIRQQNLTTSRLIHSITDAISHHPSHAAPLAALIGKLTTPEDAADSPAPAQLP
jgi:tetratricopeptide (TPR) repeat protein